MNCSQLSFGHAAASWKKATAALQTIDEPPVVIASESIRWTDSPEKLGMGTSRWSEVRSWAIRLTAPNVTPHFKPLSS